MRRFFITASLLIFFGLIPCGVHAATLYLSPSSSSHTIGDDFSVTLGVNTAGVAINAAQATVSFPTNLLEVRGVTKAGTFTLWPVEPSYSNSSGTLRFGGGVPNPGYTGSGGSIITITFRGKAEGTANVSIGSASVLANDGLGTNVLTGSGRGTYTITKPAEPPPTKPLPHAPVITSSTHSDQNNWYPSNSPAFDWTTETGVIGYSFSLDDQEGKTPDTIRDGTVNHQAFTGTGDGVWYFHVRAQNENGWGPAGHFRVRVDTVPPLPFLVTLPDGSRPTTQRPRLQFNTTDATSGVHHYTLIINNGAPIDLDTDTAMPYNLPELPNGTYTILVLAYDYAGNKTSAPEVTFTIGTASTNTNQGPSDGKPTGPLTPLIPDDIKNILPEPIRQIADVINRMVQRVQNNGAIVSIIDDIVEPTATVTAVIAVTGVAATTSGIELFNVIYLFFRFGYFWLLPVSLGKRRKPWGIVFDSTTGKPIRRAIVRLFSKEYSKLRESQITDNEGRFGFLVDPGEYFVTVERPGYLFPSRILRTAVISLYEHIYRGDIFSVEERREGAISFNVPLDPEIHDVARRRLFWLRILNVVGVVLERLNVPLLVGGTLISWISLIIQPKASNYIILLIYALLLALRIILSKRFQRSWGLVTDVTTGVPIEYAVIRIYNTATGAILGTRVTNNRGQFTALVPPGQYYVIASKMGYHSFQSRPIEVRQKHGLLRMGIQLIPIRRTMSGAEIMNLEPMGSGGDLDKPIMASSTVDDGQIGPKASSPFTPPPLRSVTQSRVTQKENMPKRLPKK